MAKPPLTVQTTTLWDYPSQHYAKAHEDAHKNYKGATPSYIIWNLLMRYTRPNDLVIDSMCGSGTTLSVARSLGRRAVGYDIAPAGEGVFRADARKIPLETGKADFAFIDPPYSTHIKYSGKPECIGELNANSKEYYAAMRSAIKELYRALRPERYMALYVSDSYEKNKPFMPIGFELFSILKEFFTPVDIIATARHNKTLLRNHWHTAAAEGNFFLRGFNYLFIMYKERTPVNPNGMLDRRDEKELKKALTAFNVSSSSKTTASRNAVSRNASNRAKK